LRGETYRSRSAEVHQPLIYVAGLVPEPATLETESFPDCPPGPLTALWHWVFVSSMSRR
jgi:hypothetical protein